MAFVSLSKLSLHFSLDEANLIKYPLEYHNRKILGYRSDQLDIHKLDQIKIALSTRGSSIKIALTIGYSFCRFTLLY